MVNILKNGADKTFGIQPKRYLAALERYFWENERSVDTASTCFYAFKPFPGDLSQKQQKSWAEIQSKALSPFQSGDHYHFVSEKGLHLWVSQKALLGIPETAAQSALADGAHLVLGKRHTYEQKWQDGLMLECVVVSPESGMRAPEHSIDLELSWAIQGHLKNKLISPHFWMLATTVLFFLATIWFSTAAITLISQDKYAAIQNQRLDPLVREKITQRQEFEEQRNVISLLRTWRSEHGYLPESLSLIVAVLNSLGNWEIQEIFWQGNQLTLQLDTGAMDIAALVTEMESIPTIKSVAIKPNGVADTFLLEASFHE